MSSEEHRDGRVVSALTFVGTIVGLIVLIGLILAFDLVLARIDHGASERVAAGEYRRGRELLGAGHPGDAIDHFENAAMTERSNIGYGLALGEAQRRAGQLAEAEVTLRALLEGAENDGAVNLALAHVATQRGSLAEAKAYYHRAIFGRWGADSTASRRQARFDLIGLLASNGSSRELLAELLPFEDVSPDSIALRRRLGSWFLLAGSPVRAANMFREVIRSDPNDAQAYAGLGEAALTQGNFRTARADFATAAGLDSVDSAVLERRALADSLIAADPTARGINGAERDRRVVALLSRTMAIADSCLPHGSPAADSARAALLPGSRSSGNEAVADRALAAATALWNAFGGDCRARAGNEQLRLLFNRVAP